jgi:hypothetical protein
VNTDVHRTAALRPAIVTSADHRWRVAAMALLAAIAVLMTATVFDYGITWDEELHSVYGELVLAWFRSGFRNDGALHYQNIYMHGGFFDVVAQLFARVSPLGLYEDRHLVNVAFAVLALAGTWRLGTLLLGARGGFFAISLTVLTPMFYGHSFNNPKDIPFAAAFVWTLCHLYESARALPAISARAATKLWLSLGILLAIRPGGIFIVGCIVMWWLWSLWRAGAGGVAFRRSVGVLAAIFGGAWVVMLSFWPWAQTSPILNALRGMRGAARFPFYGTTLFFGQQIPARHAPISYVPVWFGLQLPELYFLAVAAAVMAFLFRRRLPRPHRPGTKDDRVNVELVFLAIVVVLPVAAATIVRSTFYDAVRHFLFVIPPLAILATAGIESALRPPVPRALRVLIAGAVSIAAAITVRDMIALHPYQSVYFNRVVAGGLPGAVGRFETDYWGNSYREAVRWVIDNVPGDGIRVANCSYPLQSSYYLRGASAARFIPVPMDAKPDLLLATTRWDCHVKAGARVLHRIEREGVPLVYVLDLRS